MVSNVAQNVDKLIDRLKIHDKKAVSARTAEFYA